MKQSGTRRREKRTVNLGRKNMIRGTSAKLSFMMSLALLFGAFAGWFPLVAEAETSRVAVIQSVKGEVEVTKSGGSRPFSAFPFMTLNEGDHLKTGPDSSVVIEVKDRGDEVTVGAETEMYISELVQADNGGNKTNFTMWSGSVWVNASDLVNSDDEFEIETPTAIMGVRGTHFYIDTNPFLNTTQMFVASGKVEVVVQEQAVTVESAVKLEAVEQDETGDVIVSSYPMTEDDTPSDPAILEEILDNKQEIDEENEQDLIEDDVNKKKIVDVLINNAVDKGYIKKEKVEQSGKIDPEAKQFQYSEEQLQKIQEQKQKIAEIKEKKQQKLDEKINSSREKIVNILQKQLELKTSNAAIQQKKYEEQLQKYIDTLPEQQREQFEKKRQEYLDKLKEIQQSQQPTTPTDSTSETDEEDDESIFVERSVTKNTFLGASHTLPETVTVSLGGVNRTISVDWGGATVDTSRTGTYTFPGSFSFGPFEGIVTLTVHVRAPLGSEISAENDDPMLFDGGIEIDLSPLNLPDGASITVSKVDDPVIDSSTGLSQAGDVIDIQISGFSVDAPVQIKLPIEDGADTGTVGIFHEYGTNEWLYQPTDVVDGYAVATVEHFSVYGVLSADELPPPTATPGSGLVSAGTAVSLDAESGTNVFYGIGGADPELLYAGPIEVDTEGLLLTARSQLANKRDGVADYRYTTATLGTVNSQGVEVSFTHDVNIGEVAGPSGSIVPTIGLDGEKYYARLENGSNIGIVLPLSGLNVIDSRTVQFAIASDASPVIGQSYRLAFYTGYDEELGQVTGSPVAVTEAKPLLEATDSIAYLATQGEEFNPDGAVVLNDETGYDIGIDVQVDHFPAMYGYEVHLLYDVSMNLNHVESGPGGLLPANAIELLTIQDVSVNGIPKKEVIYSVLAAETPGGGSISPAGETSLLHLDFNVFNPALGSTGTVELLYLSAVDANGDLIAEFDAASDADPSNDFAVRRIDYSVEPSLTGPDPEVSAVSVIEDAATYSALINANVVNRSGEPMTDLSVEDFVVHLSGYPDQVYEYDDGYGAGGPISDFVNHGDGNYSVRFTPGFAFDGAVDVLT